MLRHSIAVLCVLQTALAAPQFVSFKDGKVGVNFGGYHAEAGLGGLLTGNAAHGGLSASAGTPWGPQAAAGLGGSLDGRAAGGAYAGAQYSPQIGASSVIGGDVGHGGFAGAEAHSQGHVVTKTLGSGSGGDPQGPAAAAPAPAAPPVVPENAGRKELPSSIQKIKPPKKYAAVHREHVHSKQVVKTVYAEAAAPSPPVGLEGAPATHFPAPLAPPAGGQQFQAGSARVHVNSGLIGSVLNIPIGILRSLQDSLSGIDINKSVTYSQTVGHHH